MSRWAGVARFGGIGDNLIASSVMRPLKALGYMTEMITSPLAGNVLQNNPYIDKLTVKGDGEVPGGIEGTNWFKSRMQEYDVFAHLSHSVERRHALHSVETSFWWPQEYRRKLCAGSYLETAMDIVGVPHMFGPLFFPTEEEMDRAGRTVERMGGNKYVAWVLSGSRIDKVYPLAAPAICRIIKELGFDVVMIGIGGRQSEYAKLIHQDVKNSNSTDKGLHLALAPDGAEPDGAQDWNARRSLTQAMWADVVVTPDTGTGWAVAFEPMPKVVLVSHTSVENITKHWVNTVTLSADPNRVPCWPCHRLHDDPSTCVPSVAFEGKAASCMADISVEDILKQINFLTTTNGV